MVKCEELERHSFVDNELSEKEAIAISSLVDRYGDARAKSIVSQAETALVYTRGEFSEAGAQSAASKKQTKRKVSKPKKVSGGTVSEYTLIEGSNSNIVIQGVNKLIRSGWEPLGGVSVAVRHQPKVEVLWSQAMINRSS